MVVSSHNATNYLTVSIVRCLVAIHDMMFSSQQTNNKHNFISTQYARGLKMINQRGLSWCLQNLRNYPDNWEIGFVGETDFFFSQGFVLTHKVSKKSYVFTPENPCFGLYYDSMCKYRKS